MTDKMKIIPTYKDKYCRLYQGDCLSVLNNFPSQKFSLILTDIPYEKCDKPSNGIRNIDKGTANVKGFDLEIFLTKIVRVLNGSVYVFCSTEQVGIIRSFFDSFDLHTRHCIWEKTNPSPMNGDKTWLSGFENCIFAKRPKSVFNEHCKSGVWKFSSGKSKIHPTQKPIKLFEYLVGVSSNLGDIVLDTCMGSGTTGVACKHTGRRFIGIELDEKYFELAKNRIVKITKGLL